MANVPALGNAVPGAWHDGETVKLMVQRAVLPCVSAIFPLGGVGEVAVLKLTVNVAGAFTTMLVAGETGALATVNLGVSGLTVKLGNESFEVLKLLSPV